MNATHDWLSSVALTLLFSACALEPSDDEVRHREVSHAPAQHAALESSDDTECYELRAHAAADARDRKYSVPLTPSIYIGFRMPVPWSGTKYITSLRPLVDNQEVLVQSWLYAERGLQPGVARTSGMHPNGDLLYGWATGTEPLALGPTLGMAVSDGTLLQLESHYFNKTGEPVDDASGIEVCVSAQKPENVISLSVLGTMTIAGTEATGVCDPTTSSSVRLTHLVPQMRGRGKHVRVTWNRADGTSRVLLDADYDFSARRAYPLENVEIGTNDTLTTTCTYGSFVRFGAAAWDETCEVYALHAPAGLLTSNGVASLLIGRSACMK